MSDTWYSQFFNGMYDQLDAAFLDALLGAMCYTWCVYSIGCFFSWKGSMQMFDGSYFDVSII